VTKFEKKDIIDLDTMVRFKDHKDWKDSSGTLKKEFFKFMAQLMDSELEKMVTHILGESKNQIQVYPKVAIKVTKKCFHFTVNYKTWAED
jgi:hypothetical protein